MDEVKMYRQQYLYTTHLTVVTVQVDYVYGTGTGTSTVPYNYYDVCTVQVWDSVSIREPSYPQVYYTVSLIGLWQRLGIYDWLPVPPVYFQSNHT